MSTGRVSPMSSDESVTHVPACSRFAPIAMRRNARSRCPEYALQDLADAMTARSAAVAAAKDALAAENATKARVGRVVDASGGAGPRAQFT
jgi:hypothetical protein